jgi:ribose transport system permease protein
MKTVPSPLRRLASDYGMVLVLLALGLYFSAVTITTHQPIGTDAAIQVASRVRSGENVFLVTRDTPEDAAYVEALKAALRSRSVSVAATVRGEPRDARVALEQLNAGTMPLDAILTTTDCATWTILKDLNNRFPNLGTPRFLTPEPHRWPTFLTRQNLLNVANQIAVVAILAVGMTLVILTAGIDLSVGSILALSAVLTTALLRRWGGPDASTASQVMASGLAIAGSAGVGLLSGTLVAGFRVPPFIATLAIMQIASGLAFIVAEGSSIYEVPESFTVLGRGTGFLGVPNAVWLMLFLYSIAHLLMTRTVLGRRIQAVGGNPEAARLSGVNLPAVLLFAYAFCGAMAGIGGVVQASQLKSGAPTYGQMYELYAIAAVVVGGTSLAGGEGRVLGTLIGALIIAVIQNGMNLTGVQSYQQKIVLGGVILGAVLLDLLKRRAQKA